MVTRGQEQPGAPNPIGLEFLENNLVEQRAQLLLHAPKRYWAGWLLPA